MPSDFYRNQAFRSSWWHFHTRKGRPANVWSFYQHHWQKRAIWNQYHGISLFRLCLHEGDKHPSTFNCTRSNVCNRCRSCWSMELRFVGGKWGAQDESISRKYQRDVRRNHGVFVNFLYLLAIISVKRLQSGEKIVYSWSLGAAEGKCIISFGLGVESHVECRYQRPWEPDNLTFSVQGRKYDNKLES